VESPCGLGRDRYTALRLTSSIYEGLYAASDTSGRRQLETCQEKSSEILWLNSFRNEFDEGLVDASTVERGSLLGLRRAPIQRDDDRVCGFLAEEL
jgi:hypothetical protein